MSTSEVYETQLLHLMKRHTHPISPYSISKYAGELTPKMFEQYKKPKNRIFNICRAFNAG